MKVVTQLIFYAIAAASCLFTAGSANAFAQNPSVEQLNETKPAQLADNKPYCYWGKKVTSKPRTFGKGKRKSLGCNGGSCNGLSDTQIGSNARNTYCSNKFFDQSISGFYPFTTSAPTWAQGAKLTMGCTLCASKSCISPKEFGVGAWYSFDENGRDILSNKNGVLNGVVPIVAGARLGAAEFTGEDNFYLVPNSPRINPGIGSFSIDMLIKVDPLPAEDKTVRPFADKRNPAHKNKDGKNSMQGWHLFLYGNQPGIQLGDGKHENALSYKNNYISKIDLSDGKWHHLMIIVDRGPQNSDSLSNANHIAFLVDGNWDQAEWIEMTEFKGGSLSNKIPLRIGRVKSNHAIWLDEFRFIKRSIKVDEHDLMFPYPDGLVDQAICKYE